MTTTRANLDTASAVLEFAREAQARADRDDADLLFAAVTWAEQHPPESIALAATWPGSDGELTLAGEGAPTVAEFAVAEFAAATGRATDSGRAMIAHALELKYRLPRVQIRVDAAGQPGGLAPWRARRIAEATLGLSLEAAAFVDTQIAPYAHRIGPAQLDRLVEEAIARFMPDQAKEDAEQAAERRHVTFHHQQLSLEGTTFMEAELDLADALDLDAAITHRAEQLRLAGSAEPLDVRRAMAAGELGRDLLALDFEQSDVEPQKRRPPRRQVVLYVHLSEAALTGSTHGEIGRVENHHRMVTAEQVRTWCANPDTHVVVKPVIDLNEHLHVDAYEIPDRLREQTELISATCVFPWCTRAARPCDCDHVIPYAEDGTTCSCNLAPLCRRHHRLKTHSTWTYTVLEPGTYLWSSPHGYQFLRDHAGTLDVTPERPPPRPAAPPHF